MNHIQRGYQMRVLFIGGTGLISSACALAAEQAGHDLWLVNRGQSMLSAVVSAEQVIIADATNAAQLRDVLKHATWDAVVQFVGYRPDHIADDIETFADVGQYVFISSASVYEKPPSSWLITEGTTTANPYWDYSRQKIACERVLERANSERGFPVTIVRPSLTYGLAQIPVAIGSWAKPFTLVERMRRKAKILVPGDGTAIWTLTHNSDFAKGLVGLLGQQAAIGEDYHITSDEALSWNQIYALVGEAAGVEPDVLHVPSDAVVAADPSQLGTLWGDKSYSTVFDNSKLRSIVPDFAATKRFVDGIRETVAWFDADPRRQAIDDNANALWDRLGAIYTAALRDAAQPEPVKSV
jgi:nucleoside-diphosphate-sugar epimerase